MSMRMLEAGHDIATTALWRGHSDPRTNVYLHAHLVLKERAIARTTPRTPPPPLSAFASPHPIPRVRAQPVFSGSC